MTTHHAYSTTTGAWLGSGPTPQVAIADALQANALPDGAFVEVVRLDGAAAADPPLLLIDARPLGLTTYRGAGRDIPESYGPAGVPPHARAVPLDEPDAIGALRAACDAAGSIRAWAIRHGFSQPYVWHVLAGEKPPSARLLAEIGLRRAITAAD